MAIVTTVFPTRDEASDPSRACGGDPAFVADFAAELSRFTKVHVVAAAAESHVENRGDMCIHRFAMPGLPFSSLRATDPADWPKLGASWRAGQRALDAVAAEYGLSHVLAIPALPSGLWAWNVGRRRGVEYSTWALGSDIWGVRPIPGVRSVLQRVLRAAAHRFAAGEVLAGEVVAMCGRGCDFLPRSCRADGPALRRRAEGPPYRLAFLGRWHANKGADLLLDALLALDEADWRAIEEVRYFGAGPLEGKVREGVRQLIAACRPVTVGGLLDREAERDLYRWADFLLLPSRIESVPAFFSDTVHSGTLFIATPVGDMPRLIESYGVGFLARETSGAALREAISAALASPPDDVDRGLERAVADFDVAAAAETFFATVTK